MKLVARIKKIQEEVSFLNEQCRELLAAKQVSFFMDLIYLYFFKGCFLNYLFYGLLIFSGMVS